jgi:asparagine synthase (glutamine-hydrolysing)
MCGIAGIVSLDKKPVDPNEVQKMCDAIVHRGPDDEGFYFEPGVGLGMRRLSIIDLHTGHQPIHNEDGSIQIVFNGEIFNYKELRQDLQQRGHSFYTDTDTETIVHLYEEYGPRKAVEKLRGMFAFALWDGRKRQLLLARDRVGIKPLFYANIHGRLVFASELKAILQLPEIDIALNWKSTQRLFSFLSTPATESLVKGVHKLGAGHILIAAENQELWLEQYWDVQFVPDYTHDETYFVERLRELLIEAVRLRMVSDVPIGAFLSGGLDSSSVVAMMSGLASEPIKTYTIGFEDSGFDETPYARRIAEQFGTVHTEQILAMDALDVIGDIAWYLDEPLGDSSVIPTYMVSKLAARDVKVSLSADGGDELFAGYDKYVVESRERNRFVPPSLRGAMGRIGRALPEGTRGKNYLEHFAMEGITRYIDAGTFFKLQEQKSLFKPEVFEQMSGNPGRSEEQHLRRHEGNWLSSLQYLDLKSYLPLDILTKVDRMSMAHSLEARVPLLDHKLIEFAATIPPELQLKDGTTKYIFKKAMRGLLPDAIIDRRKHGFAVPLGQWFKGRFDDFLHDLLLSETSRKRGILNIDHVEDLMKLHRGGRPLDSQLWTLISFELWCRTFMDRKPIPPVRPNGARSPAVIGAGTRC